MQTLATFNLIRAFHLSASIIEMLDVSRADMSATPDGNLFRNETRFFALPEKENKASQS